MDKNIVLTVALVGAALLAGLAVAQTATQTGREPQFENSSVKVWNANQHRQARAVLGRSRRFIFSRGSASRIEAFVDAVVTEDSDQPV